MESLDRLSELVWIISNDSVHSDLKQVFEHILAADYQPSVYGPGSLCGPWLDAQAELMGYIDHGLIDEPDPSLLAWINSFRERST